MAEDIRQESTALAVASQNSLGIPGWLQPQSVSDVEKFAAKMANAQWVPKGYINKRTQEVDRSMVEIAIMQGVMLGIPWIMAPQVIAVINGMPSIWGDGMLAVCQASGLLEDIQEFDEGEGASYAATCIVKRRNRPTPVKQVFDVERAKRAGLLGKEGPWQTAPKRMMQMRARAFALRDAFPDVLKGLAMAEEVLDMIDVTPEPAATAAEAPTRPDRRNFVAAGAPPIIEATISATGDAADDDGDPDDNPGGGSGTKGDAPVTQAASDTAPSTQADTAAPKAEEPAATVAAEPQAQRTPRGRPEKPKAESAQGNAPEAQTPAHTELAQTTAAAATPASSEPIPEDYEFFDEEGEQHLVPTPFKFTNIFVANHVRLKRGNQANEIAGLFETNAASLKRLLRDNADLHASLMLLDGAPPQPDPLEIPAFLRRTPATEAKKPVETSGGTAAAGDDEYY